MSEKVKVLIVDDTATYRNILRRVLEEIPNAEVIGTASRGYIALEKLDFMKPDLVLLDVMMPEMDGVETLRRMKEKDPSINIVMISAFNMENARATVESLEYGALDFIAKPVVKDMHEGIAQLKEKLEPLVEHLLGKPSPVKEHQEIEVKKAAVAPLSSSLLPSYIDFVVIGISTGGPNALYKMVSSLDGKLSCPILIVQHMPPLFTQSLAERLSKVSPLPVKEAESGEKPLAGNIYLAPGGKHMVLDKSGGSYKLVIVDSDPVNNCKPSVDVLFDSVMEIARNNILVIMMTGMGRDGTEGTLKLKKKGAYVIVQDKSTSVVWGMPRSVFEAGAADEVLPLEQLGKRINEIVLQ